jgi:hypothetical protein
MSTAYNHANALAQWAKMMRLTYADERVQFFVTQEVARLRDEAGRHGLYFCSHFSTLEHNAGTTYRLEPMSDEQKAQWAEAMTPVEEPQSTSYLKVQFVPPGVRDHYELRRKEEEES